jgi:hypothetical protein
MPRHYQEYGDAAEPVQFKDAASHIAAHSNVNCWRDYGNIGGIDTRCFVRGEGVPEHSGRRAKSVSNSMRLLTKSAAHGRHVRALPHL